MSARYIFSVAELREEAAEKLGPMNEGTYDSYLAKAQELAPKYGITRPVLGLDLEFKPEAESMVSESPHPNIREEWEPFLSEVPKMLVRMPDVFLVDGDKITLPI